MKPAEFNIKSLSTKLIMETNLKNVDALDFLLKEIKEEYCISEDTYNDIWVVLNEAVSNAIKHGNGLEGTNNVTVSAEVKNNCNLCFKVNYNGIGFNPETVPDPTSPERLNEPDGRGIYLMKKLANSLVFSNNGTTVEMCFYLNKK